MFEVLKQYSVLYPILNILSVVILLFVRLSNFAKIAAYSSILYGTTALFYPLQLNNVLGPLVQPLGVICLVVALIAILMSLKTFVRTSLNFSFWLCLVVIIFTTAFPKYSALTQTTDNSVGQVGLGKTVLAYFSTVSSKAFEIVSSGSRENTR